MTLAPGVRGLVLAAVAAVVTSAGAAAVLLTPPDPLRKITGTVDAAPGLAWSIDAAALSGRSFAEFRSPVDATSVNLGSAGFLPVGDTLVTVVGVSTDDSVQLRDAVMYGIDAATGTTTWQAPADGLGGCAAVPLDGELLCFADATTGPSEVVGYDLSDGTVTRSPVPWQPFALAVADDHLFVAEGDVESDDVRVHSGTLADPDSRWTRSFAMGTAWEDLYGGNALDVTHGQGLLALGADLAGFDLDTGAPTWTADLDGCSRVTTTTPALVERIRTRCDGYRVSGVDLLDRTGRILATTERGAVHGLLIDEPADDTIPVLLADTAYDRRDGSVRWTNPDLVYSSPDYKDVPTEYGTAAAVLGDLAVLADPTTQTTSGLDLRTGETRWRVHTERQGTVALRDGDDILFTDALGLWSVDAHTGKTHWDIPFRAVNPDPDAFAGTTALATTGNDHLTVATGRTMIGLRPFD
ncbi:PQQ-binding-like beta-propeller repeat protein [Nocardia sp. AG03]|uniref:outer membrane protein assembly factor BamB family protein n=1 Tax=Nocardia sp. AG03 TaxID=3025312 RepID=UPI0024184AEF|nr:PQQ-binding-like beta-propeller repeat protein [Nocardia sp. AG03]